MTLPHAKDSPPWTGVRQSDADAGNLFAERGAGGSVVLYFDRTCIQHAMTLYSDPGDEAELYGCRWSVIWPRVGADLRELAETIGLAFR